MQQGRDGRSRTSEATSAFPREREPRAGSDERSAHETSHVVRRRSSAPSAEEVVGDGLEIFDDLPASGRRPLPPLPTPPRLRTPPPLPAGPVVQAAALARAFVPAPVVRVDAPRRGALLTLLACGLLALGIGTAAGIAFRPRLALPFRHPASLQQPAVVTTDPPARTGIPVVNVADLPPATPGTVVGLSGHRLWVDGKLADDSRATVPCGVHLVQVGSAGSPRAVDVPCGGSIAVSP